MKTLWMEVAEVTGGHRQSFRIGPEILHACPAPACEAAFPQTDAGWRALKEHQFELHERPMQYDWAELDGQEVTIVVVQRLKEPTILDPAGVQTELVAKARDGTLYFLPFSYYEHGSGGFKCKPKQRVSSLLRLTPPAAESRSNG